MERIQLVVPTDIETARLDIYWSQHSLTEPERTANVSGGLTVPVKVNDKAKPHEIVMVLTPLDSTRNPCGRPLVWRDGKLNAFNPAVQPIFGEAPEPVVEEEPEEEVINVAAVDPVVTPTDKIPVGTAVDPVVEITSPDDEPEAQREPEAVVDDAPLEMGPELALSADQIILDEYDEPPADVVEAFDALEPGEQLDVAVSREDEDDEDLLDDYRAQ